MLQQSKKGATGLKCRVCPALVTAPRIDGTGVGLRGSSIQFVDEDILLGNQQRASSSPFSTSDCTTTTSSVSDLYDEAESADLRPDHQLSNNTI
ncbi:hypothetical protein PCL_01327 [Purpureocillium lilacinum]|uniref:Uncharacterized protein n=1 Tax=Purpureocillium lilacinum TaxID=33203 RepID=A0A2U3E359_PURLI|nr:hypothetical protein PCL_01327 [Purpureocillium lilacinum]